jgi:mannose-6-phosphate isomerase-like protein (cupin superfamily)
MSLQRGEFIPEEVHEYATQFIVFLDGTAIVMIEGEEFEFRKGDSVGIPSGTHHKVENRGDDPLQLDTIYSPPQHHRETMEVKQIN